MSTLTYILFMLLKDYLKINKISQNKFANKCNLARSSICKILSGERFPSPHAMNNIEIATLGQVKANDFMKEYQERIRAEQSR